MLYRLFFQKYNAPSSLKGIEKYDLKLTRLEGDFISIDRSIDFYYDQPTEYLQSEMSPAFIYHKSRSIHSQISRTHLSNNLPRYQITLFIHNNKNEITV